MKKVFVLFLSILLLNSFLAMAATDEITSNGFDPYVKIYYPDTIPMDNPFDLKIDFVDREIANNFGSIRFNFNIPFEYTIGKKEYPYPITHHVDEHGNGGFLIEYSGQKTMTLPVVLFTRKSSANIDMLDPKEETVKYDSATLRFKCGHSTESIDLEGFQEASYPFDYEKETETEEASFSIKRLKVPYSTEAIIVSENELLSFDNYEYFFTNWMDSTNYEKSETYEFEHNGLDGKVYYQCWTYDYSKPDHEQYTLSCRQAGLLIRADGIIGLFGEGKAKEIPDKASLRVKEEYFRDIMKNALITYTLEQEASVEEVEIEERSDLCGECKQGYVCGACGECIRETESYDPKRVNVDVELNIKNGNERILNSIESNLAVTVTPEIELTYGDEKIEYCDLKEPGLDMKIEGRLITNESFSGFTSGFPTDERETEADCDIDFDDPKCVFIISPNDRKKFFADAKDIIQKYEFTAEVKQKEFKKITKITLVPPGKLELDLDSKGVQVHQGSTKVLEITPKGGTTENIIVKASLMGPGHIGLTSKTIKGQWVLDSVAEGTSIKIGYQAPSIGNFDIGKELASLSMVDLQKKAAEQIAIDALTAYAGADAQYADELADAGMVTKEIGHIAKEFKVINGVRNIKGVHDGIPGMTDELGDAARINEDKAGSTWAENAADVGVVGISAAQTAVGVLTFIPNKIPYFGEVSASWQSAFSAATNIWKANLQYVSKSEKINRAQELYYPVGILVTAQDISGWTTQKLQMFKIAYHELK